MRKPKLYLAGPDIFLPNAKDIAELQKAQCKARGFEPLHPMDNNIGVAGGDMKTAMRIYRADYKQVQQCDIIVANCNGFRGVCADDGTAVELGLAFAMSKLAYGYIRSHIELIDRTKRDYACHKTDSGLYCDKDGYMLLDDFGTKVNLMLECGIIDTGGKLLVGDFANCLNAIRFDLDHGYVVLPS